MATLQLTDVPEAVRRTIEQHAAGRKRADIDKETWNNRTVYEVEFAQAGRNAQIHVAEDGALVKSERKAEGVAVITTNAASVRGIWINPGPEQDDCPAWILNQLRTWI